MTDTGRPDAREQIESLGREVYGDDFGTFLATPRARSAVRRRPT